MHQSQISIPTAECATAVKNTVALCYKVYTEHAFKLTKYEDLLEEAGTSSWRTEHFGS